jgi:peptidoglycan/LPS O-acetylase OafA/YrhL
VVTRIASTESLSKQPRPPLLTHIAYRPDIDGLRAIAVLSVVGFHAFPKWLTGGFIGVDIFFVISGFLISSIIFSSLDAGSFKYVEFYSRRIKRIFPALLLVLCASYAVGWFVLTGDEYKQLGKHIAGGAGFVPNFILWNEAGYFDSSAETKPLLHLWSLGIEEQFYILWPLLLALVWKRTRSFLAITVLIGIASFAVNVFAVSANSVAAFYSPLTRFWELMIGGSLAHITRYKPQNFRKMTNWQSLVGLGLIGISVVLLDKNRAFPGWWALLPTVGAYLIISAGPTAWLNRTVLANKVLVWFGLISFPLYLWHWPLLVFPRLVGSEAPAREVRVAAVLMSIVLAWMTYRLAEKPIRFGKYGNVKTITLVSLMLAIGCVGYNSFERDGFRSRYPKLINELTTINFNVTKEWREHKCFLEPEDDKDKFVESCLDSTKRSLIFLWGDSHAAALYPGLKNFGEANNVGIAEYTASNCLPLVGWTNPDRHFPFCKGINDEIIRKIKLLQPDLLILHANWTLKYDSKDLENTSTLLHGLGVRKILLIGPVPQWGKGLPQQIFNEWRKGQIRTPPPVYMNTGLVPQIPIIDKHLRELSFRLGFDYISAYEEMCNREGCISRIGENANQIVSFDYGHLSPAGSVYLINSMAKYFLHVAFVPISVRQSQSHS